MIPKEMLDKPAKFIHHKGINEFGVEQITEYFGKIEKIDEKTKELTLKVILLEEQYKKTPDFKHIIVKEQNLEISFAVTKINSSGKTQVYYEKLI